MKLIIKMVGLCNPVVQSEHAYVVETFEPISLQLHSSKVVNARSDKTYTITINN